MRCRRNVGVLTTSACVLMMTMAATSTAADTVTAGSSGSRGVIAPLTLELYRWGGRIDDGEIICEICKCFGFHKCWGGNLECGGPVRDPLRILIG